MVRDHDMHVKYNIGNEDMEWNSGRRHSGMGMRPQKEVEQTELTTNLKLCCNGEDDFIWSRPQRQTGLWGTVAVFGYVVTHPQQTQREIETTCNIELKDLRQQESSSQLFILLRNRNCICKNVDPISLQQIPI